MFGYIDTNGMVRPVSYESLVGPRKSEAVFHVDAPQAPKPGEEKEGGEPGSKIQQRGQAAYKKQVQTATPANWVYARQLMNSPVEWLSPQDTSETARNLFHRKGYRQIPISNDGKKLLGMLVWKDFLKNSTEEPASGERQNLEGLYQTGTLTAALNSDFRQLVQVFLNQKVGALPILNESGFLAGIVTKGDVLKVLRDFLPLNFTA